MMQSRQDNAGASRSGGVEYRQHETLLVGMGCDVVCQQMPAI
jgi:hypothetical protein